MSSGQILTLGLGSFAGVEFLPTLGYYTDATPDVDTGGGIPSRLREKSKRLWIDGVPYDIPIADLGTVEAWLPKPVPVEGKSEERAEKRARMPRIEVVGRLHDGAEIKQEIPLADLGWFATFYGSEASFVTPGVLDVSGMVELRKRLDRNKRIRLLLMVA